MCKLGVLGYGVVGQAVVRNATDPEQQAAWHQVVMQRLGLATCFDKLQLAVFDDKQLTATLAAQLQQAGIAYIPGQSSEHFLRTVDLVVPSPGVPVHRYQGKVALSELALFYALHAAEQQVIGITGSLGKTTVTKLITALVTACNPTKRIAMGGNVGIGMLDLVTKSLDVAVLELSSYQLYQPTDQGCAVAVWTNLYPNHLDWHGSTHAYVQAKAAVLKSQHRGQKRVCGAQLILDPVVACVVVPLLQKPGHATVIIAQSHQEAQACHQILAQADVAYWYPHGGKLEQWCNGRSSVVYEQFDALPPVTFALNWAMAFAAVYQAQGRLVQQADVAAAIPLFPELAAGYEHRMELFATYNNIHFFNDSKSTVQEATLAAAACLLQSGRPLWVIVGGLGKGVDRSGLAPALLAKGVSGVLSWGPEAAMLQPSHRFARLADVVAHVVHTAKPGDQVLFSPSGASFDAFANYQERGKCFKELVHAAYSQSNSLPQQEVAG